MTDLALATDGRIDWQRKVLLERLDIVRGRPDRFEVTALAAERNVEMLANQVTEFSTSRSCRSATRQTCRS